MNIDIQNPSLMSKVLISGAVTIISVSATTPLERVKVLLQNQSEMVNQDKLSQPYKDAQDFINQMIDQNGVSFFWRGNTILCIHAVLSQLTRMALKGKIMTLIPIRKIDSYALNFTKNVLIGTLAGTITICLFYSLIFAYTRLASDIGINSENEFNGAIDVYRKTLSKNGICGLYRGFGITCVGHVLYTALTYCLIDFLKPIFVKQNFDVFSFYLSISLIGVAVTYPLDTIRRRMMMTVGVEPTYDSSIDCFNKVTNNEGYCVLFQGLDMSLVKVKLSSLLKFGLEALFKKIFDLSPLI